MSVHSKVLAKYRQPAGLGTDIAQVPANCTWIIKDIFLENTDAGATDIQVWCHDTSTGDEIHIIRDTISKAGVLHLTCWVVMTAGQWIAFWTSSEVARIWISGVQLYGIATP